MRYLLDTNIFLFAAIDRSSLNKDVVAILEDYDNTFYMSSESVKELIVNFNNGKIVSKHWKSARDVIRAIRETYYIQILSVGEDEMQTYSQLDLNLQEDHKAPSDHVIISHAITRRMPLISSDHKFIFYEKQGLELIYNKQH